MQVENQKFIQITKEVLTSLRLSKGAKLFFGALYAQEVCMADERQQELPLGLPPLKVKVVRYEPKELAVYMQWSLSTVRRYMKELIQEGWVSFQEGKSRGKNRKLVLQIERPATVENRSRTARKKHVKPTQLEAFEVAVPLSIPAVVQEIIEPKDKEQLFLEMQVATAKINKRIFSRGLMPLEYVFAPLTLEDLQTLWTSWDMHHPSLPDAGIDPHLQNHLEVVKQSQEPHSTIRAGKMFHLYTGALALRREIEPSLAA